MEFTPYAKCVWLVRRQIERAMTGWGCAEDDTATAVLICGEMATNAVEHARVPGERFEVQVTVNGNACLIEVSDPLTVPPRPASPTPDDEHGRGLHLVAALADDFGHRLRPEGGKTVWARLTLTTDKEAAWPR
ncbi:ATP-binding protein [Streptomyces sp. NPDC051569]|uniref:ATP-binding protein n=1 Tax=Streptomyces sp. NPDC051569 TaxID=3365661 RepID=UPI0037A54647